MVDWRTPFEEIEIGKGKMVKNGEEVAILSIGNAGNFVVEAQNSFEKEGLNIAHFDMRFVKPIDKDLLHIIFQKFNKIITIEDGCLHGGFGSAVIEFMADNKYKSEVIRLGVPDEFINHGTQEQLYAECYFDVKAIKETKQVLGYAEYFGLLRIVSCLTQNYTGDDQEITYAINPMTGYEIDLDIELNFSNEERQRIYDYEFYNVEDFQLTCDNIMKTAIEFSENRELERALKNAVIEAQKFNDLGNTKEENARIISMKIVEFMKPYLNHRLRKAP
jgi:hypothetical protein